MGARFQRKLSAMRANETYRSRNGDTMSSYTPNTDQ